jgi:outer membrane protein insertion porin family
LFDEKLKPEEKLLVERLFPAVRLSTVSASLVRDTRTDPIEPVTGALISVDGDLAARAIGSEVGFFKTFVQGSTYRRLSGSRGMVAAFRAELGLATGFPREVVTTDEQGRSVTQIVKDLPASERFYAGGDNTVRGFALDRLGTPETIDADGFPKGGHGLLVLNAELRVPVRGGFGVVGFLDAGNVFVHASDFSLGDVRASAGFGIRYRSPVGPIRVDLGFKLDRRMLPTGARERATAVHVSLGQTF